MSAGTMMIDKKFHNLTVISGLSIAGQMILNSTLSVDDTVVFGSRLSVASNVVFASTLSVSNATVLASQMSVASNVFMASMLSVGNTTVLGSRLSVASDVVLAGTLSVAGNALLGNAVGDSIGFYGVSPVTQPSGSGQAAITNSTGGTPTGDLELVGATNVGNVAGAINNNFTELYVLVSAMRTALVNLGLMKGSA